MVARRQRASRAYVWIPVPDVRIPNPSLCRIIAPLTPHSHWKKHQCERPQAAPNIVSLGGFLSLKHDLCAISVLEWPSRNIIFMIYVSCAAIRWQLSTVTSALVTDCWNNHAEALEANSPDYAAWDQRDFRFLCICLLTSYHVVFTT